MTPIDDLARRHWDGVLAASPISATLFGVHDHDDRVADLSAEGAATRRTAVSALLLEVDAAIPSDDRERVTVGMLRAVLEGELTELGGADGSAINDILLRCEQMDGPDQTWLQHLPQVTYPSPTNAAAAVRRYAAAETHLTQAADRFREALDRGITPVSRNCELLVAQVDRFLSAPIEDDPLVAVGGPAGWAGEAAWREQLSAAVRDHVRPALRRYRDRVLSEQLPNGRDDAHAGLAYVDPDGSLYRNAAKVMTSLDIDADDVHRRGVDYIAGPLAEEWSRLGTATFGEGDPRALMDRLRAEPSLRYGSSAEMLAHAEEAFARASSVMGDWFGRLPVADCVVRPVPEHLASAPPHYLQPAPDGSRPGTYFVTADVGSMLRTEGEATAFHEAIPGHHLQLAIAGELEGVPEFLKHSVQVAYAEGWGLYAERLADEMGLYSSDNDRLGMLSLDAFRAARLVVDTGLHAQGWSRQRAIDEMLSTTPLPLETIEAEVDRYIAIPGQALGYKLGQMEIRRLRRDAEARLGAAFDIKGFHDTVLGSGMLTLDVLADVVDRWVVELA